MYGALSRLSDGVLLDRGLDPAWAGQTFAASVREGAHAEEADREPLFEAAHVSPRNYRASRVSLTAVSRRWWTRTGWSGSPDICASQQPAEAGVVYVTGSDPATDEALDSAAVARQSAIQRVGVCCCAHAAAWHLLGLDEHSARSVSTSYRCTERPSAPGTEPPEAALAARTSHACGSDDRAAHEGGEVSVRTFTRR